MVRSPDVPKKTATARERQEKAEEKKTRGREKEPGMRQRQEGEEAADLGNKEMTRGTIGNRGNCVGNGQGGFTPATRSIQTMCEVISLEMLPRHSTFHSS